MAIGASAIGAIDELAASGGDGTPLVGAVTGGRWRRHVSRLVRRFGEEVLLVPAQPSETLPNGAALRACVRTFRDEELVGDLRQSDMSLIVSALDCERAGLTEYFGQHDRLVRWPDTPREAVFMVIEEPQHIAVRDEHAIVRAVVRGGQGHGF